ncbi:histidine--tRNA ligase [Phaeocystidibacter luteus]|uniref:Histidine--tRNA ligase n=1 Tax=Phaeocystidibacter luteus TaxID=911197 RepID=A0A6N6RK43_9FLAO|nr:histidine--tRNA ligase [Phaeocystidibacter luteus]KAB2814291.1 histidine--tRNA ligase [Phaeocystidibacter luteus]
MAVKPSIPKGTRDFNPQEVNRRHYIMSVLRSAFEGYGFQPIETPSFENIETLTGKYGEEGDRLIFKILRSGDFLSKVPADVRSNDNPNAWTSFIADKALRYDLTVPFARYVVQHRNELAMPFKRYQMQPVWRADRPQKGRFREFWQCDADVVGSDSLWQEVEFVQLYDRAFGKLGLKTEIHLNNRKVLAGIAEVIGASEKLTDFTVALDKLDKIGADKVVEEMVERGIPSDGTSKLLPLLSMSGNNEEVMNFLEDFLSDSEVGKKGLEELGFVLNQVNALSLSSAELVVNLTLARGLDYYTGAILEVKAKDVELGSIGGGGRYDDLTGIFGMPGLSGMGVSFGLDRIYLCLEELNLFPEDTSKSPDALFFNMGDAEMAVAQKWAAELRNAGFSVECYPDSAKFKKQFDYAEKKGIKYTVIMGDREIADGVAQVKNIESGEQEMYTLDQLIALFRE